MELLQIKSALQHIMRLLAEKEYTLIYAEDALKRITADELQLAIEEYGGNVTLPPEEAYDNIYIYTHDDAENECTVEMYVWINQEQSDLTLSCDLAVDGKLFQYAINDILVL